MNDAQKEIHAFDDIKIGQRFADRFGRMYTKSTALSAEMHGDWNAEGRFQPQLDTTRSYRTATQTEIDRCDMQDAGPYYLLST